MPTKNLARAQCAREISLEDVVPILLRKIKSRSAFRSAGRTKRAPTLDFAEQDWNDVFETNLTGTLRACQVFGRHMIERGYGRIINIASLSTFVALFEVAAYSASK